MTSPSASIVAGTASTSIVAAEHYERPDDLAVITAYFNAGQNRALLENYKRFSESLKRSGIELYTVELAFGSAQFELPDTPSNMRIRSSAVMWQKERLLNLAVKHVPKRFKKIAWIDADIFFENHRWAVETSAALESCMIAQPFSRAIRLPKDADFAERTDPSEESFTARYFGKRSKRGDDEKYGHTGLAWAARREFLEQIALYEACPLGGADRLMAHAFCGDYNSNAHIKLAFQGNHRYYRHFVSWADRASENVRASVQHVEGIALHRWHGNPRNRHYYVRTLPLSDLKFDPDRDLESSHDGALEWKSNNRALIDYCANYLAVVRNDDSEATCNDAGDAHGVAGADDGFWSNLKRQSWRQDDEGSFFVRELRRLYRRQIPLNVRLALHYRIIKVTERKSP